MKTEAFFIPINCFQPNAILLQAINHIDCSFLVNHISIQMNFLNFKHFNFTLASLLLLSFIILTSFKVKPAFHIKGIVKNNYNGYIYLQHSAVIDSQLVKDGRFEFKGEVVQPVKAYLCPKNPNSKSQFTLGEFMLENSALEIHANIYNRNNEGEEITFLNLDSISGSKSQVRKAAMDLKISQVEQISDISSQKKYLYSTLLEFISSNPKLSLSGDYLGSYSNYFYNLLEAKQIELLYKKLNHKYQNDNDLAAINSVILRKKLLSKGKKLSNIVLPDQNGKLVEFNTLPSKLILIEFWASWCAPCRQTVPELLNVYKKYKDRGFEIYGISIDENTEAWQKAIAKDQSNWVHVIDTAHAELQKFKVNKIPFNILVNENREIIDSNLSPEALDLILQNQLSSNK